MPVENPYIFLGQLITFFYFSYFILVIYISLLENYYYSTGGSSNLHFFLSAFVESFTGKLKKNLFSGFFLLLIFLYLIFILSLYSFIEPLYLGFLKNKILILSMRLFIIYNSFIFIKGLFKRIF